MIFPTSSATDIEIVFYQRHTQGRIQPLQENCPRFRDAIRVNFAEKRDPVGAWPARTSFFLIDHPRTRW
jgi:hypothetical protein